MKNPHLVIALMLALFSCHRANKRTGSIANIVYSCNEVELDISDITTAYEFEEFTIPEGYYLDSNLMSDKNASFRSFYLQSEASESDKFNTLTQQNIRSYFKNFIQSLSSEKQSEEDYEISIIQRPVSFFIDDNTINVTYVIDSYSEGAAHHNYVWKTDVYDINTQNLIQFSDVFTLKTEQDSAAFVIFSEQHSSNGCSSGWGNIFDEIAFAFSEEGIVIHPNLGWSCSGTKAVIPADATNPFLKEKWKNE